MGSIPKIVLTPVKWASKKLIDRTLLRFPSGNPHDPIACTYCPEMCRFSCPTAVVSGNDAVTPCNKNSLLYKETKWPGQSADGGQLWTIYDCTGCGRCTNYCVYGMPVADYLFSARSEFAWDHARAQAAGLTDEQDSVGDLAFELGDTVAAERRRAAFVARAGGEGARVHEPKELHFLLTHGAQAELDWQLSDTQADMLRARLGEKRWLVHESPWLNRRLGATAEAERFLARLREAGAKLEMPFQHGADCIDCGGEGAYPLLFAKQAERMARDFWERDAHRAEGILCFSERCAAHFRNALDGVPVVAISEVGHG